MSEPVIACSLNATDQSKRLEAAADLRDRALVGSEEIPGGLRMRFSARPGIRKELEQLIAAESGCCSFLRFELRSRERDLILEVTGPDQARPIIAELFGHNVPAG
jgi:hypothetical protein